MTIAVSRGATMPRQLKPKPRWITEEEFNELRRLHPKLIKVDHKWSEGSSPILLVIAGYDTRPEHEKCFWYNHPSPARCHECEHINVCKQYAGPLTNE